MVVDGEDDVLRAGAGRHDIAGRDSERGLRLVEAGDGKRLARAAAGKREGAGFVVIESAIRQRVAIRISRVRGAQVRAVATPAVRRAAWPSRGPSGWLASALGLIVQSIRAAKSC